ncbi:MAG: ABC transporter permease, partial [Acidobacteriaceae bacterium]|nr:ABC transporter permease [Acidobacteriaceae bacterium]
TPAFTLIAVTSLALAIGANTAIFSFVDAILLKQLPVPDAAQLVTVSEFQANKEVSSAFSYPFLDQLNKRNQSFDGIFGRFRVRVNLTWSGVAEPLSGEVVTGAYFQTLRIRPALGRLITDDDITAATADPVCVISYAMWQQRLGADPGVVGRKLLLNAHPYTVIGVTPPGFYGSDLQAKSDLQLPVSRMGDFMGGFFSSAAGATMWKSPGFRWLELLGRLKPGITAAQAQSLLQPLARQIDVESADPHFRVRAAGAKVFRLLDGSQGFNRTRNRFGQPLTVLMGIVALVLLIACANLANLLLARGRARQKEIAIRLSLGASRSGIVRHLMIESLTIAACGGLLGFALSFWIIQTLLAYLNSGRPPAAVLHVSSNMLVLGFALVLSLFTALLFGLGPAWQSARVDTLPELKDASTGTTSSGRQGFGKALIVFQIAISVVILFSAGLLTRTLSHLQTIDLGFRPANVLALSVDPAMNGYSPADSNRILDQILERLRAQPGITSASLATVSPLDGTLIMMDLEVPGHTNTQSDAQPGFNMISPGYFTTLNQRLLGRDFSDHDTKNAASVAIVNEFFVSQYMPGQNPIGRHFQSAGSDREIVGLVGNAPYLNLREAPRPVVYLPAKHTQSSGYTLLVQAAGDSRGAIASIEHTIRAIDPKLPIYNVRTLQAQIDQGVSSERMLSFLSTLFSFLATLLCCIGLYGIVAYSVSRRIREIGVRFAVGAQKSHIARLFLLETVLLLISGIVIGIPAALVSSTLFKTLLYGLRPSDPSTLLFTIAIVLVAGMLAVFLPVRRAAAIEPLEALRYE